MAPLQATAIIYILKEDCSCVASIFSACAARTIGAAHSIIVLNGIAACVHGVTLHRSWVEGFSLSDNAPESLYPGSSHSS